MLQNELFTFGSLRQEGDKVLTDITLNAAHPIFTGHFPAQPILPGACMMQMVKEVTANYLGAEARMVKADDIKFLSFIDPEKTGRIQLDLKINIIEELVTVEAKLLDNATPLFKFRGTFKIL